MSKCCKCKKFSSVTIKCKCDNMYCLTHLLPENHSCEKLYDFHRIAHEKNEKNVNECSTKHSNFVKLE
jgi:hypothetical protein